MLNKFHTEVFIIYLIFIILLQCEDFHLILESILSKFPDVLKLIISKILNQNDKLDENVKKKFLVEEMVCFIDLFNKFKKASELNKTNKLVNNYTSNLTKAYLEFEIEMINIKSTLELNIKI